MSVDTAAWLSDLADRLHVDPAEAHAAEVRVEEGEPVSEQPDDGDVYSGPVRLDPVSEPVGWNVYYGSGGGWQFREFIPNELVLFAAAEQLAGQVEAFVSEPEP